MHKSKELVTFKYDNITVGLIETPVTNGWGRLRGYSKNVGWKVDGAHGYCLIYDLTFRDKKLETLMKTFNNMVKEVRNGKIKFSCKK